MLSVLDGTKYKNKLKIIFLNVLKNKMSVLVKKKCENCLKKTLYYNTCKCQKELCLKCLSSFSHKKYFPFLFEY